jgi:proteic killer suppression protein
MIKTFRCKETEKIFRRQRSLKLPQQIQKVALRKLGHLHAAKELRDLLIPPANRLEPLAGNRQGQYSNSPYATVSKLSVSGMSAANSRNSYTLRKVK